MALVAKILRVLVALGFLALCVPLLAGDRPLIVRATPAQYYADLYAETRAVWRTETVADLDGRIEMLSAMVTPETRARVEAVLADRTRSEGAGVGQRPYSVATLERLLDPAGVTLVEKWFFPAFAGLAPQDLLFVLLLGMVWIGLARGPRSRAIHGAAVVALGLAFVIGKASSGPADIDYRGLVRTGDVTTVVWTPIPHAPNAIDLLSKYGRPSEKHWLGTDSLGRDLASRLVWGARVSLSIGLLAVAVQLGLGIVVGGLAGLPYRVVASTSSRFIEGFVSIPSIVVALAIIAVCGSSFAVLVVTIAVAGFSPLAQMFRAEILRLRQADFIRAAQNLGLGWARIFVHHLLPNAVTPVLGHLGYAVSAAILMESSLSFLGLGIRVPSASWGGMLSEARGQIQFWWLALLPGVCILSCVLLTQRLADRAQRALEARPGRL